MEKSSFFNAELVGEDYDRTYLAEDYAQYFASFIGNGVFPNPSNNLQVLADGTSMNVSLSMGKAWINGYFYANTTDLVLDIAPADGVLNRIDRVVLRLDFLNREIRCYVKKGNFASTPIVPAIQRDADMYEIALADIKINKGAIAITQANITDLRQNSDYCGIVHGTVDQVDVTTLFNQYENALQLKEQGFEEEFTTWFNNIKGQLSGDVATNLAVQIEDLRTTKVNYTDLAPITTTGTSSAYIATIPTNMTEVTIVPHISNMAEATLNGVPILDRDGEPVRSDILNANIPVKLVRVGNSFFIASGNTGYVPLYGNVESEMSFMHFLNINYIQKKDLSGTYWYNAASSAIQRSEYNLSGTLVDRKTVTVMGTIQSTARFVYGKNVIITRYYNNDLYLDVFDLDLNLIKSTNYTNKFTNMKLRGIDLDYNRMVLVNTSNYLIIYDLEMNEIARDTTGGSAAGVDEALVHFVNKNLLVFISNDVMRVINIENGTRKSYTTYKLANVANSLFSKLQIREV